MLFVGLNLFMSWSPYLIFDIQCPLVQVKIKVYLQILLIFSINLICTLLIVTDKMGGREYCNSKKVSEVPVTTLSIRTKVLPGRFSSSSYSLVGRKPSDF
jgi:hypothetical protein